jgi:deoxyadenosine/deoxycytidine kinase
MGKGVYDLYKHAENASGARRFEQDFTAQKALKNLSKKYLKLFDNICKGYNIIVNCNDAVSKRSATMAAPAKKPAAKPAKPAAKPVKK